MDEFQYLPIDSIIVPRHERQRATIDDSLSESIARNGIINPITIRRDLTLVAGERRLAGARKAGLTSVPVRFFENLSLLEAKRIELEENLKRLDLPWQDECIAIAELHRIYCQDDPEWTQEKTGTNLGLSFAYVAKCLRVRSDLTIESISKASTMDGAYNLLRRKDERASQDAVAEIIEAGDKFFEDVPLSKPTVLTPSLGLAPPPRPEEESILHANFLDWAPHYTGPKFNLIHCDFPYGVNVFNPTDRRQQSEIAYADDPDLYWHLIKCLGENLDRLCAPSAHLVFWFSMNHYQTTLQAFAKSASSLAFQIFPLIWLKSDNTGMVPDVNRQPRRIYETAFLASREDRLLIKPLANAYAAPTDKDLHPSTKPEPVLRHFFSMLVDESTRILDPTCGSGSALRAAESLGAKAVLGLEVDEKHCANARGALRLFRAKRAMGKIAI